MSIVWSKYSLDIFEWVSSGRGDLLINAVAGSGKSTNLVEVAKNRTKGTTLMCAFNSHIAKELQPKVGENAEVRTIHSLGYGAIAAAVKPARIIVDEHKYRNLTEGWFDTREQDNLIVRIFDLVRATLTDHNDQDAVINLLAHHNIEGATLEMVEGLSGMAMQGLKLAKQGVIDYTDMVWLPHVMSLYPRPYQWVMVDECQDLNASQLSLVLKARGKGGRMIFVGDPRQAIYGFAGADANSFYNIKSTLNATELPLSVCYRCPSEVIELAQQIVPTIEAAPGAPAGKITSITDVKLVEEVREGDLVLCRLTAPLISACIEMIKNRIPARVRGRDIAASLTSIVKKVAKINGGNFDLNALGEWDMREVGKITAKKNHETQLQIHEDKVQGIVACWQAYGHGTTAEFIADIEGMFTEGRAGVMLSTIHKAKGLEEKRVFALKPEKCPLSWEGMTDWQYEQEMNLKYVMITRAKEEFVWVETTGDQR